MEITEQELAERADLADAAEQRWDEWREVRRATGASENEARRLEGLGRVDEAATVRAAWGRVRDLVYWRFQVADTDLERAIQAERDATAARLEAEELALAQAHQQPELCRVVLWSDALGEVPGEHLQAPVEFEPEDVEELGLAEAARRDLDAAGLWPGGRTYVEHQGDPYAGEVPEAEVALECGRCGHSQVVNGETVTWAELREECTNCGGMMKAPAWVIARLREANLDQELGPDYGAGQGQVEALCRCGAREVFCPESAPDVPGPCPECGTERTW